MAKKDSELLKQIVLETLREDEALSIKEILEKIRTHKSVKKHQLLQDSDPNDLDQFLQSNNRKIQRCLDYFLETPLFQNEVHQDKDQQPFRYSRKSTTRSEPTSTSSMVNTDLSIAIALAVTDKFSKAFMPVEYYEQFVEEVQPGAINPSIREKINRLIRRIAVEQRGQPLKTREKFPREILDQLYLAFIEQKQIRIDYFNNRKNVTESHTIHPVGVRFRDPKIFLMAFDKTRTRKTFTVEKIRRVDILKENIFPDLITLDEYLETNASAFGPEQFRKPVTIEFEVKNSNDNLTYDIQTHPLSAQQKVKNLDNGDLRITLPDQPVTHDLIEWFMGRMSRVTVTKPKELREYIRNEIEAMLANYTK